MQIIQYPHPTLARRSKPLRRVDTQLRANIAEMFELMYAHNGCGLAANQVDLPYRVFVMNASGDPQQKDEEMVFINPVLSQPKGMAEAEEGCLSLPGLYVPVKRPERITIQGYNLAGQEVRIEARDHFARVVQHETDHLDGVLMIDRISEAHRIAIREQLDEFDAEYRQRRERGEIPDDGAISARWSELESLRT